MKVNLFIKINYYVIDFGSIVDVRHVFFHWYYQSSDLSYRLFISSLQPLNRIFPLGNSFMDSKIFINFLILSLLLTYQRTSHFRMELLNIVGLEDRFTTYLSIYLPLSVCSNCIMSQKIFNLERSLYYQIGNLITKKR